MAGVIAAAAVLLLAWQNNADLLDARARDAAEDGNKAEAERLWKQALSTAPASFPVLYNLGYFYILENRPADAEPLLARAAQRDPRHFQTRYLLGRARLDLGQGDDALSAWREAAAIKPGDARLLTIMAIEYANGGYFSEAAAAARKALAIVSDERTFLIAIKASYDAGDSSALDLARQAVEKFPESARTNFEYGFHLQRAGRHADSLRHLEKAMALDPSYEEPFFFYGGILLEQGRLDEAETYLRKAVKLRRDYTAASVALAGALVEMDRLPDALEELKAAAAAAPKHPQPYWMLSRVYFRLGDEARAAEAKRKSMELRRADRSAMELPQSKPFPK